MKLDITKEWFEKRAAAEGDSDPTTGRRKTMTLNLTEDEVAELERLVNPNREAIRAEAFEEAASLVEAQWNHCWPSDIAAAIRALATQAPAPNAQALIDQAIAVERERCARIAEGSAQRFDFLKALEEHDDLEYGRNGARIDIARAIREGAATTPPAPNVLPPVTAGQGVEAELIAIRKSVRNAIGAIESNQVVDKDVHGTLNGVLKRLDALAHQPLSAHRDPPDAILQPLEDVHVNSQGMCKWTDVATAIGIVRRAMLPAAPKYTGGGETE